MSPAENLEEDIRTAEIWLLKHVDDAGVPRTPAALRDALQTYAQTVTNDTFRRMRARLRLHQESHGFHKAAKLISEIVNPVAPEDRKKSPKRTKKVTDEDLDLLIEAAARRGDRLAQIALTFASTTGIRPAEMREAQLSEDGVLRIISSKQQKDGSRSIPVREMRIYRPPEQIHGLRRLLAEFQSQVKTQKDTKKVCNRISYDARKLWPNPRQRKTHYSFRHKFGSDAKAAELSPEEIAALLGHKSMDSQTVYGRRRYGVGKVDVRASQDTIEQVNATPMKRSPWANSANDPRPK